MNLRRLDWHPAMSALGCGPSGLYHPNGRFRRVTSTGQRNILFSNYREGGVEYEAKTEDLLHGSAKIIDVGALAERRGMLERLMAGCYITIRHNERTK